MNQNSMESNHHHMYFSVQKYFTPPKKIFPILKLMYAYNEKLKNTVQQEPKKSFVLITQSRIFFTG